MSKAQVTLFIILGIVILFIFAFVFVVTETAHEKKLEAEVEKTISDFLKSKTINYYVTTCLDKFSKESLILIGEQGGFIYNEQNGLINWNIPSVEYKGRNVVYQIYNFLSDKLKKKNPLIYNPPYYPCFKNGPDAWTGINCYKTYSNEQQQYFFGSTGDPTNNINPDLCKEKITIPNYVCSCYNPPNSLNCKYSIQSQLEYYIKKKVKECADFSNIKGYDISAGDIKADVSFSDNNVLFKIDFPITIIVKGSEPIIEVLQFSLPQQIRFKILYNLARELINKDIDDINFDIVKDGQKIANNYGDIKITKDTTSFKDASIIILEDTQSKIDGKNYVFMFTRENRNPALDYMKFISFDKYDLYIIANQTLNFTPTAYDPDEHTTKNPLIYDYFNWSRASILLKGSRIYTNPNQYECIHPFSEVSEKKRCASYELSKADIGEHKLIVKTEDLAGLYDYQDINILVDDIPKINLILNNTFIDIDNNLASIEDPFIFDASKTTDEFPKPVTLLYKWTHIKPDNNEGFSKDLSWSYTNIIYLPKQQLDIKNMMGFFDLIGIHKIMLEVKNQQPTPLDNIAVNRSEIIVSQCLPHRSKHASYPFNNIGWDLYGISDEIVDDFQGNHTCCRDDYNYADKNQICYNLVDYGCLDDFTNSYSKYYDPGKLSIEGSTPSIDYSGSSGNRNKDVYERTLIRKCKGDKGNICNGDVTVYQIKFYRTCTGNRQCTHSNYPGGACKE